MSSDLLAVGAGPVRAEAAEPVPTAGRRRRPGWAWLGLVPFFGYLAAFFLVPTAVLLWTAFQASDGGGHTWANLTESLHGSYLAGLQHSVEVSLLDGVLAAVLGLVLAQAIVAGRGGFFPRLVSSASAVLANFGGLPLAFLFVAAIGNAGVLTSALHDHLGISLSDDLHFDLYSIAGVEFVYLYFLVPLMVLVITPALEGLKPQWQEAARNLGATRWQYWRYVAGPVLAPSVFGAAALLFCAAFSAYATAAALTNGTLSLTSLQIGAVLSGNVLAGKENVGAALAFDMIVVVVPLTLLYLAMQRRTTRWLR
ncbi:MAG: ABC transporter permease subunit [Actinomycetota bacterium]|nr:ABC transporter permease subunit [Actinomycetota bacterium]MDQ2956095.1 ABC transporter permease subunit [Actinomycetota bacterium]